jgi:chaperone required for assembly of F1-ATPase
LWDAANLEEDWQVELWGKDWEAAELRAKRAAAFAAAAKFAQLARN